MDRKNAVLEYRVAETNGATAPKLGISLQGRRWSDPHRVDQGVRLAGKSRGGFRRDDQADRHEPVRSRVSRVAEFRGMTSVRVEPFGFQAKE